MRFKNHFDLKRLTYLQISSKLLTLASDSPRLAIGKNNCTIPPIAM